MKWDKKKFLKFIGDTIKSFIAGFLDENIKAAKNIRVFKSLGPFSILLSIWEILHSKNKIRELFIQPFSLGGAVLYSTLSSWLFGENLMTINIFFGALFSTLCGLGAGRLYDYGNSHLTTEAEKKGAGLDKNDSPGSKNGPGGVELKNVEPISGVDNPNIYLTKSAIAFFENSITDIEIKRAFNSIVLPEFRNKKIQDYFETIMQEVSDSLDLNLELPFVSLHFNKDKMLYSVMPSFYRNTIIGNVFTFLDYFLKGFVNGGYFSIDFVRDWASKPPNLRNTNLKSLNSNLIEVKNELKKVGKSRQYFSMGQLIDQNNYTDFYDSAFRIIGKLKFIGTINDENDNGIYFPKNKFSVEHDLNPKPEKQKLLETKNEKELNEFGNISSQYFKMRKNIKKIMPEVPDFRGFFAILDMISFAYHYAISLRSVGKKVETKNAFHFKNINYSYQIPDVFPPLPVADRIEIKLQFKLSEIISNCRGSCLDREIKNILLGRQKDFTQNGLIEISSKLKYFYKQKILSFVSIIYDEEELIFLPNFCNQFINIIKEIPNDIINCLIEWYSNIEKKITNRITSKDDLKKLSFSQLRQKHFKNINDILYGNYNLTLQSINRLNAHKNVFSIEKCDFYSNFNHLVGYEQTYKSQIHVIRPTIVNEERRKEIIGGCKFKISKKASFHNELKTENELNEIYSLIRKNNKEYITCKNGTSGYLIKLNIISLPLDGSNLLISKLCDMVRDDFEFDKDQLNFSSIKAKMNEYQKNNPKLDKDSQAYYACCSGDIYSINELIKNGVNFGKQKQNGIYPFLAAIMNGHHDAVVFLLTKSFARLGDINRATETNLTPLHWAIYHNFPDIVELLLKNKAYINIPMKSDGMTAVHLACYHDRPECLSLLITLGIAYRKRSWFFNRNTEPFIDPYGETPAGKTPLQIALENSPRCASILINNKKVPNMSIFNHIQLCFRDNAIMNGQYQMTKRLPDINGKMKDILSKDSTKKIKTDFDQLCFTLSSGDIVIAENAFSNWYERFNKVPLNDEQKEQIVEQACIGGCENYVQLLSKAFNLKEYPIALRAAHYGLVEWIEKIEKYGGELMVKDNNRTIFDEAVENSDYEFIEKAFKIVEKVPEKIIKRVVQKSIQINDLKTMSTISTALLDEKSLFYLDPSDIFIPSATINTYYIYKNNLNSENPIKLDQIISDISTSLVSYLLSVNHFTKKDLISAYKTAINQHRNDNGYAILEKNPSLFDEIRGASNKRKNKENAYNEILAIIRNDTLPENDKINRTKNIFSDVFDFGDLPFVDPIPLIRVAGFSINNLWILRSLPKRCIEDFYLFDDAIYEDIIEILFKKEFSIFENLFGRKKAGFYFLNSLRKLDFKSIEQEGNGNEFISSLLQLLTDKNLLGYHDKDNQTIFHYISKFNSINSTNIDSITEILKKLKPKELEEIINARTRTGETVMMSFAISGNLMAIEYISKMIETFYNRDIYGDNILHKILSGRGVTNNDCFLSISYICKKSPELIIQRNRKGENPFMLAAKNGFNGILGLMSNYYPIKILDSFPQKSILHIAALYNRPQTVRYIVQNLHVDVNIKSNDGSTPLHFAAQSSSHHAYTELISLGGNPLIQNVNDMTAIDNALKYGNEKIIQKIMKSPSFIFELSSPKILTYLVYNVNSYSAFVRAVGLFDESAINTCNSEGMNLISLACLENNRKCVSDLLMYGCDPEKTDKFGRNSLHICALRNAIGCSDLILNHINQTKGMDGIKKILNTFDLNGNLPIHYAAKKGLIGFLSHLLSICKDQDFLKENNYGRIPFAESIFNNKQKAAGIIAYYWTDVLHKKIDVLISKIIPELRKKWGDEFTKSDDYHSCKEIVMKIKEILRNSSKNPLIEKEEKQQQKVEFSRIELFKNNLKESKVKIQNKFIIKCSELINNMPFRITIDILLEDKAVPLVNLILDCATNMKSNKIRNIAFLMFLPILDTNDVKEFIKLIIMIDQLNIDESHPLFSWIENGLISIVETTKNRNKINKNVQNLITLISYIMNNKDLENSVSYPVLPAPIHEISNALINFENEKFKKILIRFVYLMNVSIIYDNNKSLSIDFCNRIDDKQNILLNYLIENNEHFEEDVYERAIQMTLELYDNISLNDEQREKILSKCISLLSKDEDTKTIKNQIGAWITNSVRIIDNYGYKYFKSIINIIPSESLSIANESLSYILIINSPDIATKQLIQRGINSLRKTAEKEEKKRFVESRNLDEVIKAFNEGSGKFIPYKYAFDGTPVIKLKSNELKSLRKFGEILEKENKILSISEIAIERGKNFRNHPTIENAAKLVSLVRQAIRETFDINPFIIQCLTVASMLLHRINKDKRNELKGRIAQVATGEGKSIIVAMLSGCIGLTGNCVDVISSSPYLAMRDAEKFKPFYEKLGLKCGTVNENNYNEGFDFHILYSTNTGFEFALLREGIRGKTMIETTLLYENVKRQRPRMTAIVDEADNLFIDTANNSARIAQGGNTKRSWIFKPIWQEVIQFTVGMNALKNQKHKSKIDVKKFRRILQERATNEERLKELDDISNEQLTQYISSAIDALSKKRDVDYVVGKNKKTGELEIQIVDAENTGRVMYGSRWCNGLHEFIELKEGLPIKEQTYTVASICHPSFFEPYEEIYGLTGTLGEESERNEIFDIYHVDSFDVPPNRKCQRKRDKTLIFKTDKKKEEYIIETINRMKSQGRPILIIVYSIEESERLSNLLRKRRIDHFILNDQQPQDEDFVVDHAGRPGSVTVATNTAGRGTDIHIEKAALKNGGLHTLITFWPANLRVECQALGRSARQGQPGSSQIIFSSNKFGNDKAETTESTLKTIYEERTDKIEIGTQLRLERFLREKEIFEILKQYFDYIRNLNTFLQLPESLSILNSDYKDINPSYIITDLGDNWARFYTSLYLENNDDMMSFDAFLKKWNFKKKFPSLSVQFNKWLSKQPLETHIATPTPSDDVIFKSMRSEKIISMGIDDEMCDDALSVTSNNISVAADLLFNASQKGSRRKGKSKDKEPTGNLAKLISMGFDQESSEEALKYANDNIQIAVTLLLNKEKNNSKQITKDDSESDNENENEEEEEINEMVKQLMMMGFDEKSCRLALKQSKYNLQDAANILADRNEQHEKENKKSNPNKQRQEIEKLIDFLVSMGYDRTKCEKALIRSKYNVDNALDLLINDDEKSTENDESNENKTTIKELMKSEKKEKEIEIEKDVDDKNEEMIVVPDETNKIDNGMKSITLKGFLIIILLSFCIIGLFYLCFYFIKPSFYHSVSNYIDKKTIQFFNSTKDFTKLSYQFAEKNVPILYSKMKNWFAYCYQFIKANAIYIYAIIKNWISAFCKSFKEKIPIYFSNIKSLIISFCKSFKEKIPIYYSNIKSWIVSFCKSFKEKIPIYFSNIKSLIVSFCKSFKEKIPIYYSKAKSWIANCIQYIKEKIPYIYSIVIDLISCFFKFIKEKIVAFYSMIKILIINCYQYLKEKILQIYQLIKNKLN